MLLDYKSIDVAQEEKKGVNPMKIRIDFLKEVFFIVAEVLMGAIVMAIQMTFLYAGIG